MLDGGLRTEPVEMTVQRPIDMAVCAGGAFWGLVDDGAGAGRVACRSPRRWTSDIITVRPPRVMFAVPVMALRRDTLLPESWEDD